MKDIKITRQNFKEALPSGTAYINKRWIKGFDWMISFDRVKEVPSQSQIFFNLLEEDVENKILDQITKHYRTAHITSDTIKIYDNIEPNKIHRFCIFQTDSGEEIKILKCHVDTFKLKELRFNSQIAWTLDEKFLVKYL